MIDQAFKTMFISLVCKAGRSARGLELGDDFAGSSQSRTACGEQFLSPVFAILQSQNFRNAHDPS